MHVSLWETPRCKSCLAALLRTRNGGPSKSLRIRGVDVGAGGQLSFQFSVQMVNEF